MAVLGVIEIEAVELVDDLAHRVAGLHVVIDPEEDLSDQLGSLRRVGGTEFPKAGHKPFGRMVDEDQ